MCHTTRHLVEEGVAVEAAARSVLADASPRYHQLPGGHYNGMVVVGGRTINYSSLNLPNETLNFGRIAMGDK